MVTRTFLQPQPQTTDIIIGPGAMGLLLVWDLCSPSGVEKAILIGKNTVRYPIHLESPNLVAPPITSENSSFLSDISLANLTRSPRILVTVPPNQVKNVIDTLARATLPKKFTVVFCNNGLISSDLIAKLLKHHPEACVIRALLHVGARREVTGSQTLVVHTGGLRATWGWVHGTSPETLIGKVIQWEYRDDILKLEAEKLFINLVLAEVMGNRPIPNGELWNRITKEKTQQAAEVFCEIFSERTLNSKSLLESLSQTVCDTAQNINSISAALTRNDSGPRDSVEQSLRDQSSNKSTAAKFFGLLKE
jgi:ketopantoate reductase